MGAVINFLRGKPKPSQLQSEIADALRRALEQAGGDAKIIVIQNLTVNYCSGGGASIRIIERSPV